MASYAQEDSVGRTRGLAEFLMEQLSSQPMFMDIDIIPGVWMSRSMTRRQHWEAEPVVELSQASKNKSVKFEGGRFGLRFTRTSTVQRSKTNTSFIASDGVPCILLLHDSRRNNTAYR